MTARISSRRRGLLRTAFLLNVSLLLLFTASVVQAQSPSIWQPLNQRSPLGQTAAWMQQIRQQHAGWLQPVRVEVPGGAEISIYNGSEEPAAVSNDAALFAVDPGHTYRLRIANMGQFPDAELYPSIEVLDRLHPPVGQEDQFPIPLPFSRDEIRQAIAGRLVTRVIYLEQPQIAQQTDPLRREIPQAVLPTENVLQEADRLGRPMLIVRLGSRRPTLSHTPTLFYGTGGAVQLRAVETRAGKNRDDGFVGVGNSEFEGLLSARTPNPEGFSE